MAKLDTPIAIRKLAMDILAMREHGRIELKRKLLRKGALAELVEAVLDQLTADKLLSEHRYLETYIHSRANSGYGPLRIQQELLERGINKNDITTALAITNYDWYEQLNTVWQRKFNRLPQDQKEKAKQGRFLLYRGFSLEMVSQLLKEKLKN